MNGAQAAVTGGGHSTRERFMALLHAGFWLTAINFIACIGHFFYQFYMTRVLTLSELAAFNTTLSLVNLMVVPLAAASQSITHDLAWHHAKDNKKELLHLQVACQKLLRRMTWILSIVALVLIQPLTVFFNFPRVSLMVVALACVPITMWSLLGSVWCAGLSRFKLLAGLNFGTMLVRIAAGMTMVYFLPKAESAVAATFVAGWVLASVVIFQRPPQEESTEPVESPWNREFIVYLGAALFVGLANFIYCFIDQLIAQRYLDGDELGLYVAAGLLARAVFWGSQPLLVVYFTQRSGREHSTRGSIGLWLIYVAVVVVGVIMLVLLKEPLCRLLLGPNKIHELQPMLAILKQFTLVVLPVGILQGLGFYYLAAERIFESYLFGILGLAYCTVLIVFGRTVELMLSLMFGGAVASLLVLLLVAIIRWGRSKP